MSGAFDDDFDQNDQPKPKVGLKIKQNSQQNKTSQKYNFDDLAEKVHSKDELYKKNFFEYSTQFKSLVKDSILEENKTELSKNLEKDIVNKLIKLASEMNADENQPEGIGSIAIITLLLKISLLQRDVINDLKYKIHNLETKSAESK